MNALLLKHAGGLKNYGTLKSFTHKCVYKNQTCGDKVVLYLKVNKQLIKKISYKKILHCSECFKRNNTD